jgi:predicted PurR-regulated permease PerM
MKSTLTVIAGIIAAILIIKFARDLIGPFFGAACLIFLVYKVATR